MTPAQSKQFIEDVRELREKQVLEQTISFIKNNEDPMTIINECERGMVQVGKLYEQGKYFISSLIVAGEIFRQVAEIVQPLIKNSMGGHEKGTILLGTVHGDIHDLGKNLFGLLMRCHGFTVYDIGVDVPPEEFCSKAAELKPDIIGLSGLLTIAYDSMGQTVSSLKQHKNKTVSQTPVIIRSTLPKKEMSQSIGADYYADSAIPGVQICKQILADKKKK